MTRMLRRTTSLLVSFKILHIHSPHQHYYLHLDNYRVQDPGTKVGCGVVVGIFHSDFPAMFSVGLVLQVVMVFAMCVVIRFLLNCLAK